MSSLWTPSGEVPIRREPARGSEKGDERTECRRDEETLGKAGSGTGTPESGLTGTERAAGAGAGAEQMAGEEARRRMAELRDQLIRTPAEVLVANHAYGLFELASLHLSLQPPQLEQARLAIDAMAAIVEGLGDRLGEQAAPLTDGLAQLRLAYVQIHAAQRAASEPAGGAPANS